MRESKFILTMSLLFLVMFSCKKRDQSPLIPAEPPDRGEVITTLKIVFTDSVTGDSKTFYFSDPDGPGGHAAFYGPGDGTQSDSVIKLQAATVYHARLLLLNESLNPSDTVSNEIAAEGEEHMIFYDNGTPLPLNQLQPAKVSLSGGTDISYTDKDAQQNSIGLLTRWKTGGGNHLLRITLMHNHGDKSGDVKEGETDLQVYFKLSF